MAKRKMTEINFNPKKTKFIDIIYSEFDSDPDSEEDPEWLPKKDLISETDSETKDCETDSDTKDCGTDSETEDCGTDSGTEDCGTDSETEDCGTDSGTEDCGTESEESNP